jgi:site-specific DNA-methyltransferase (adenine-specific)
MPTSEVFNMDCMEGMAKYPDKYFELAIVDPPYGIGMDKMRVFNDGKKWDNERPSKEYFIELKRISKNQIIWGGNYFEELWPCKGFIIWDKKQPESLSFAMIELATCTINKPAKMYFTKIPGKQGFFTVDGERIHPTQKPIKLYKWLLANYTNPGDKILDTHLGSGSSRIAAYEMGFDFTGFELDKDYYDAQEKRFNDFKAQLKLF